jgi:hypothetical protein
LVLATCYAELSDRVLPAAIPNEFEETSTTRSFMISFLANSVACTLGGVVGTLLYMRFLGDADQIDWHRAVFVGVFTGLASAVALTISRRKKVKQKASHP